jgi:hypothetical protein
LAGAANAILQATGLERQGGYAPRVQRRLGSLDGDSIRRAADGMRGLALDEIVGVALNRARA